MLKTIKNIIFKNLSTDIAFRYYPVLDLIRKNHFNDLKILEFGSGDYGIAPFLKRKIVGLDINFSSQKYDLLEKFEYGGSIFPFSNNQFDLTLSVDSFEHIIPSERQMIVDEILRVTKKAVILMIPCGALSSNADKNLKKFFYKKNGRSDRFLDEHITNGLPEKSEVFKMIRAGAEKNGKEVIFMKSRKMLNLKIRFFFMKCMMSNNFLLKIIYYLFLILLPFRKFLNFGACYREIFLIELD